MKKIIYAIFFLSCLSACNNSLNITPKGETVLDNISDIETLLNQNYDLGTPIYSLGCICNECYTLGDNVKLLTTRTNTLQCAWLTYNEQTDRKALTSSDIRYTNSYKYIYYMNVIIGKLGSIEGAETEKAQLSAEAHIMRAYLHWLLINMYAAQYDESTATNKGGIPYVTDYDISANKEKVSLAEVYKNILLDCDDKYINALPDKPTSVLRAGKAWGNAVRAKVLMQMKRYSDALPYALNALKYNDTIEDRSVITTSFDWSLLRTSANNLLYMCGYTAPYQEIISLETVDKFEEGDFVKNYAYTEGSKMEGEEAWNATYGELDGGVNGALEYRSSNTNLNCWGITAERMYYTAAECYIRTGEYQKGLDLVNQVRRYRIDSDHYTSLIADNESEAMLLLQKAKWIECIGTYENFFDCKRWNTEDNYKKTIIRDIPGIGTFSIKSDSPLWIFPFPLNATQHNVSLTQNY
ncbi:MAG: RagB/SusD family nutrient uptake outer membrane protein [Bacteroidales bacterium]|nr:RagB/SusD family nutrient uptake outer membrane protein [Bacteroidales bacterium]